MDVTQDMMRETFRYCAETGRLERVRPGLGARVGKLVGSVDPDNGHRRAYFAGKNRMTAHLVWILHKGEAPAGILRHRNGVNADDRIENLELLKKQLAVSYPVDGMHVNEYGRLPARITAGVYEIVCVANGRRYVGSAVRMAARWRLHYTQLQTGKHHSRHLQWAWNKYGEDAFFFRVLEECDASEAVTREQHFIDTLKPDFNSRPTAGSQLGWKPSDESRAKMRAAHLGKPSSRKGVPHTEETKAKIRQNRKGKGTGERSAEWRANISAAVTGRVVSAEQKARISATLSGRSTGRGKLSADQVREVRNLTAQGLRQHEVATRMGVPSKHVHTVVAGHGYSWVT